jgi:dCTP deaminase
VLVPGELYLGVTVEYTETHRHVPFLEGKSSGGRLGLSIHATAGKGDVGFCGHWTLEITVARPLRVYARMPIGQLIYHTVSSQPIVSYDRKHTQKYSARSERGERSEDPAPVASRMHLNFDGSST